MNMSLSEKNFSRILLAVFLAALVGMLVDFFAGLSFPDSYYNFLGTDKKVELKNGKPVWETFQADRDGMDRIKVRINNPPGFREKVLLELADESCEHVIAADTVASLSPVGIYYRFDFPRIADSQGKKYCFRATFASPRDAKDGPGLYASEGADFPTDGYWNSARDKFYPGWSLQIRPAYANERFSGDIQELVDRLSQYKPEFLKGFAFQLLAVLFVVGTAVFVVLIVRR